MHEIFFQVFDKGMMDDSEGRRIDFKNCLILLTSNVGSEVIMRATDERPHGARRSTTSTRRCAPPLLKVFPAAFLGRVVTIPYYPLSRRDDRGRSPPPASRKIAPPARAPATTPSW